MSDFFSGIVGQDAAVVQLRAAAGRPVHAYLFVGPAGAGKASTARAFAAVLLDDERALRGTHPDVVVVEREGASISVVQAREIARLAARSPVEGDRKVLVLSDFHLVDEAAPALLKTIEEASASTIFVILAESVPRELVTVASRCVRIDFQALSREVIEQQLVGEGVTPERAVEAAAAAFGNLERARLLAADDHAVARRRLWTDAPSRLDGTGSAAARLADEISESIDHAIEPLVARQEAERKDVEESIKQSGQSVQLLKQLETRHKREQRRLRTDELRAGLATLAQELSGHMQIAITAERSSEVQEGLDALQWVSESLTYNPNEALLLQGLFVRIGQPAAATGRR